VEKPWPVYVLDHHGNEHYVEMQPGDMVLYEGASCSHGREQPLVGDWFANVSTLQAPAHAGLVVMFSADVYGGHENPHPGLTNILGNTFQLYHVQIGMHQ
jgi:hypothetical protein